MEPFTRIPAGPMFTPTEDVTETLADGRTIQKAVKGVAMPMHEAIKFVIDEAERHEATAVVIVHHSGQIEGMCTDIARELTHKNHLSGFELNALEHAQALVLDLEKGGIRANYLNPSFVIQLAK